MLSFFAWDGYSILSKLVNVNSGLPIWVTFSFRTIFLPLFVQKEQPRQSGVVGGVVNMVVSEKTQDSAMREIISYYDRFPTGHGMTAKQLCNAKVCTPDQLPRLINVLSAQELIACKDCTTSNGEKITIIKLRTDGIKYFEEKAARQKQTRKNHMHDWLIAIFSALAGAFLSKPLWELLAVLFKTD